MQIFLVGKNRAISLNMVIYGRELLPLVVRRDVNKVTDLAGINRKETGAPTDSAFR